MAETNMRNEIKKILKNHSIAEKTHLGDGADSRTSEIHLNLNKKRKELKDKEFGIQFEITTQTLAIWNIKERVINGDSLNLYAKNKIKWEDITDIKVDQIGIGKKNSERTSLVAVLPFSRFEEFIKVNHMCGFGISVDTKEFDEDELQSVQIKENITEGQIIYSYGSRYERNPELRKRAIRIQGYQCKICGFDFAEKYGSIGEGFIEVHHIKPLHEGEQCPDPAKDLICICPNCHRMIHKKKNSTLSPDELKSIIAEQKKRTQGSIVVK